MATKECGMEQSEAVRMARHAGEKLSEAIWGRNGPPCDSSIDEIEEIAAQATIGIFDGVIARALELQNEQLSEEFPCPDCQHTCKVTFETRTIVGRRAEATIQEPVCHCPVCDRDFFPSAGIVAAG